VEFVPVTCPYCFEDTELELDPATEGELVSDCPVCCNPWRVLVRRDEEGAPVVELDRAQ
jgi:Cysteine-rich CPXCG